MKKIIFIFIISVSFCFALNVNQIDQTMKTDLDKTLSILKDKSLDNDKKSQKLFEMFDSYFDYKLMAKLALSKHYNSLNDDEKARFSEAFERRLKKSFTDKLVFYTDQNIEITGSQRPNPNRYFLDTQILNDGTIYKIIFKFYKANADDFLIYDVDILGVSIIQTYRSQFNDLSGNLSFEQILKRLDTTNLPDDQTAKK